MKSRVVIVVAAIGAVVSVTSAPSCGGGGQADDAGRALVRVVQGADSEFASASRLGRKLPSILDNLPARPPAQTRLQRIVSSPETASAVQALVWSVSCDVLAGEVPRERGALFTWTVRTAAGAGMEFLGDGAQVVVDAVLSATEISYNRDVEACNRLRESGL